MVRERIFSLSVKSFRIVGDEGKLFKAEVVLQADSELPHPVSRLFNRAFFGAGVKSQTDAMSQLNTIAAAYFANLTMIFLVIAAAASAFGYLSPFQAPLAQSSFSLIVTLSNLAALASTYIASLQWTLHDDADQFRKPRQLGRPLFFILLLPLFAAAIFFLMATYIALSISVILASIGTNSFLLLLLVSDRALKRRNSAVKSDVGH